MFYIVTTPIGNLSDMTYRAVEVLKSVDCILCEDTRESSKLLKHYKISTPKRSFHKFNEAEEEEKILEELHAGKDLALISDAGMPGVSDPGERLIGRLQSEGLEFTLIPGASAPQMAVVLSGFPVAPYQFIGFLPKKPGELKKALAGALYYPGTTVCFESPHRINKTLKLLKEREVAVVRELTKKFEEVAKGKANELAEKELKGEICLVFPPAKESDFSSLSGTEHVTILQEEFGLEKKEALKLAAHLRGQKKKEIEWNQRN